MKLITRTAGILLCAALMLAAVPVLPYGGGTASAAAAKTQTYTNTPTQANCLASLTLVETAAKSNKYTVQSAESGKIGTIYKDNYSQILQEKGCIMMQVTNASNKVVYSNYVNVTGENAVKFAKKASDITISAGEKFTVRMYAADENGQMYFYANAVTFTAPAYVEPGNYDSSLSIKSVDTTLYNAGSSYYLTYHIDTNAGKSGDYFVLIYNKADDTLTQLCSAYYSGSQKLESGRVLTTNSFYKIGSTYSIYLIHKAAKDAYESSYSVNFTSVLSNGANVLKTLESSISEPYVYTVPGLRPDKPSGFTFDPLVEQVRLKWDVADDQNRLSGYEIYQDGLLLAAVPKGSLGKSHDNGTANGQFTYIVDVAYTGTNIYKVRGYYDNGSRAYGSFSEELKAGGAQVTSGSCSPVRMSSDKVSIKVNVPDYDKGVYLYAKTGKTWKQVMDITETGIYTYKAKKAGYGYYRLKGYYKSESKSYTAESYSKSKKARSNVKSYDQSKASARNKLYSYPSAHFVVSKIEYSGSRMKVTGYMLNTRVFTLKKAKVSFRISSGSEILADQEVTVKKSVKKYGKKKIAVYLKGTKTDLVNNAITWHTDVTSKDWGFGWE